MEKLFRVSGVTCSGCVAKIEDILSRSNLHAYEFEPESLILTVSGTDEAIESAIKEIKENGYDVKDSGRADSPVLLVAFLPLVLILNLSHFGLLDVSMNWQFALSLPLLVMLAPRILTKAFSAGIRNISLELFVSLSVIAGFCATVYALLTHDHKLFFAETYSTILYIISLGGFVERKAFSKFNDLFPKMRSIFSKYYKTQVVRIGGTSIVEVQASQIREDSKLLLGKGDRAPVDLVILEGSCWVDESILTGQFYPVFKKSGDLVTAGSVILEGSILANAVSNFFNSTFRRIFNQIKSAHSATVSNPLNQVLVYFVPVIVVIALVTAVSMLYQGMYDQAITRSLAVLVIACPCAIGIALPLALSVSGLKALSFGAVVKNSDAILALGKAQSFLIDKTGTLTEESYVVESMDIQSQEVRDRLLSAQSFSNHPLAKPVVEALGTGRNFYTIATSKVEPRKVVFNFDDNRVMEIVKSEDLIFTVYLDKNLVGTYKLVERKREQLVEFLNYLKLNFKIARVVSGDSENSEFVDFLKELNFPYTFGLNPKQKLETVAAAPRPVVFVGDGLNDAAALEAADCGISFSYSTSAIQDKADIVLTNGKLKTLINVVELSRFTRKIVWQNLFWGSLYNLVAVPLAAFGYIYPTVGAFGMVISDLVVVFNSLRINRFTPK